MFVMIGHAKVQLFGNHWHDELLERKEVLFLIIVDKEESMYLFFAIVD